MSTSRTTFCGYISPDGTLYPCDALGHSRIAGEIVAALDMDEEQLACGCGADGQVVLDRLGYIKVSSPNTAFAAIGGIVAWDTSSHVPTRKQIEALMEVGAYDARIEEMIEKSKFAKRIARTKAAGNASKDAENRDADNGNGAEVESPESTSAGGNSECEPVEHDDAKESRITLVLPPLDALISKRRPDWAPTTVWVERAVSRVMILRDENGKNIIAGWNGYGNLGQRVLSMIRERIIDENHPMFIANKENARRRAVSSEIWDEDSERAIGIMNGEIPIEDGQPENFEYSLDDFFEELEGHLVHDFNEIAYHASWDPLRWCGWNITAEEWRAIDKELEESGRDPFENVDIRFQEAEGQSG